MALLHEPDARGVRRAAVPAGGARGVRRAGHHRGGGVLTALHEPTATGTAGASASSDEAERRPPALGAFAVHGHFYQPPREDPFTGATIPDPSAQPARDWNERIAAESYAPNAAHGNFGRIGWDLGPTLARWLRREQPALHDAIVGQDDGHNGMAQSYHHAILPLASARDRRTEIRWGMRDFELRVGRRPTGMWLPETAVDRLTLRICVEEGLRWTILAPWQAARHVDPGVAYAVEVGADRPMVVGFYDAELSAAVSFDPGATIDADRFVERFVRPRLKSGETVMIATDGELYGHHQKQRELFLQHLLTAGAAGSGVRTTSPGGWLGNGIDVDALPRMAIRERTSWSCHHGVARWGVECPCSGEATWKAPLRAALDRLAAAIDVRTELAAAELGVDPWAARDRYVDVASEFLDGDEWACRELTAAGRQPGLAPRQRLQDLMHAQASRLAMFASCGWFWDDPNRPEVHGVLRCAAHAARLMDGMFGSRLEASLVADLEAIPGGHGGWDGRALYVAALRAVGQPV
ncbi:MAG: DUF3536 domain-containing protein [Chloroflexota bacterium]